MPDKLPDISVWATPLYLLLIAVEVWLIRRGKATGRYEARDAAASLTMGAGSVIATLVLASTLGAVVLSIFDWVYQYRIFDIPFQAWAFVACFLLDDFRYYWSHRFSHTIRWCWASHVVHHSSEHYNLTTALRQPWLSLLTGLFVLNLPLILLGFHPVMVVFVVSVNLFYQFFIHTETVDKLPGPLEWVLNTPSHHRVHHGRNLRYLDANYAGVLIIWDKLFGTFVPEQRSEPVEYGLVTNIKRFNPLYIAFHGYLEIIRDQCRKRLSIRERLGYLLAPPGWSHDGSRQVTRERKRDLLRAKPELAGEPGYPAKLLLR